MDFSVHSLATLKDNSDNFFSNKKFLILPEGVDGDLWWPGGRAATGDTVR